MLVWGTEQYGRKLTSARGQTLFVGRLGAVPSADGLARSSRDSAVKRLYRAPRLGRTVLLQSVTVQTHRLVVYSCAPFELK